MEEIKDTYRTLLQPSEEIIFKEKKSKFYGYAFPIIQESEVKPIIETLKQKHHTANHVCYAWQLGIENPSYRANDDGEPNNSAGMPIYGQIQSFNVTNVLVAVARIFGGTKLGVGGLISAYKNAAQLSLENASITKKIRMEFFELSFDYQQMDKVMRAIKQYNLEITDQTLELNCKYILSVRLNDLEKIKNVFEAMYPVEIKML